MKIQIICHNCGEKLIDKFESEKCLILTDGDYLFDMECLGCGSEFQIKVVTSSSKIKEGDIIWKKIKAH